MKIINTFEKFVNEGLRDQMTPKTDDEILDNLSNMTLDELYKLMKLVDSNSKVKTNVYNTILKIIGDTGIDMDNEITVYVYNPHDFSKIVKNFKKLKQGDSFYVKDGYIMDMWKLGDKGKKTTLGHDGTWSQVTGLALEIIPFIRYYYHMSSEEALSTITKNLETPINEANEPTKEEKKVLKKRWDKKRSAITNLGNNIKNLRTKVSKYMDSEDEKTMIIATIVRIIDLTGERVGNDSSAGEGHHGVTNFLKKHAKINGDHVTLSYTGKSGVKHKVSIKDSKVARNMQKLMKIPGEIFVTTDGLSIKSPQVNKFLSDFNITSKDLRGFKVNKLMSERLRKIKTPETSGEIKKKFNEVLRDVAEEIGHTPGICRSNYLLPEIEEQFYAGKEVQKV